MQSYLALILGAIIGSSIRYLFYLINLSAFGVPLSTIIVNVIGSSLAGFFYGKFQNSAYVFMYVGLFGSLTTLSSFNLELFQLLGNKDFLRAIIYFLFNIIITLAFFYIFHVISLKIAS
ncbi:MAG: fluoride efflux transporter FluC [Alphaproteobacteria bacterium]|jgi:CrcB protein